MNIKYKVSRVISVSGGYQFLDAKDKKFFARSGMANYTSGTRFFQTKQVKRSDYFGLFNRSRHTANFKLLYENESSGWSASIRWFYRGSFGYSDLNGDTIADDPREMVKGHVLMNTSLAKSVGKRFQLQAGIENIFDYTNAERLPDIPGRLFFININYSIGKSFQNKKNN